MGCSPCRLAGWLPPGLSHSLPRFAVVAVSLALFAGAMSPAVASAARRDIVHLFVRSPVLVRAGERVQIPVDAVCSTPAGRVCPTAVGLFYASNGAWRSTSASASAGLRFDTSALAAPVPDGAVRFRVTARPYGASSISVPGPGEGGSLAYYVTDDMPSIPVPAVAFGKVEAGKPVLVLPWGSGPLRAGLRPALESAAVGPSSFDVDAAGHVLVADQLHGRVAEFNGASIVRQTALPLSSRTDVVFADGGAAYVATDADATAPQATVTSLDPTGAVTGTEPVGAPGDRLSELRTAGADAYAHVLPLDGWLGPDTGSATTGMPLAGGDQLLKIVDGHAVRLGTVRDGQVSDAVELTFSTNVGELALAEPDGSGGYFAVVHVWQETPTRADQYEVVHVRADHSVATFAVANQDYTDSMPLSKFRLGQDGQLYALQSLADGVRIVRYDLGGIR